jgi:hypothetical protein
MKSKEFNKLLPLKIKLEDYVFEGNNLSTSFRKVYNGWSYSILFSTSYYSWVQSFVSGGYVENEHVNKIYMPLCEKYHLDKIKIILNNRIVRKTTDTREFRINNEQDLDEIVSIWKKDIFDIILPFFEEWSDLKRINDEVINKINDWNELSKYIPGNTPFFKGIIMRLCNNPNYNYFFNNWLHEISDYAKNNPEEFGEYYKAACELRDVLSKTEPIYK